MIFTPFLQTLIQGGIIVKKFLPIIIALILALSLSACGFGMDNSTDKESRNNIMSDSIISSQISETLDSATTANFISRERAIEIALKNAGLQQADVYDLDAELDRETGGTFWDVDFEAGDYEYSYDIDAKTEKIIHSYKEPRD